MNLSFFDCLFSRLFNLYFVLFRFVIFFISRFHTRIQLSNEAFHMPNSFRRWIVQFSLLSESIQMSAVQLFSIWFVKINWPSNQAEECEQTASVWATVFYPVRDFTYILVRFSYVYTKKWLWFLANLSWDLLINIRYSIFKVFWTSAIRCENKQWLWLTSDHWPYWTASNFPSHFM